MAIISFQLDSKTGEAKVSIDGKEIPSCKGFSYYSYNKGFDLSIEEKEYDVSGDLDMYTTHRACGSAIISTQAKDSKKAMSAFASEIFKRKN